MPRLAERLQRIEFHGRTPSEQLKFSGASFDAVTAQYALEYTEVAKSLDEIRRVLRPGGYFMCICHSVESGVYAETLEQIETSSGISQLQLVKSLAALLHAGSDPARTQAIRASFDQRAAKALQLMNQASPQGQAFISQLLTELGEIYKDRQTVNVEELNQRLKRLEGDLSTHMQRLHDLQAAALTAVRRDELEQLLTDRGFGIVASEPLIDVQGGHCLGHCVQAHC